LALQHRIVTVAAALRESSIQLGELLRHPAVSPGWLGAWSAAFGAPERDPALLAGRDEGHIAGALVLCRRRVGPLRLLHSTTNGHSQYTAFGARDGAAADVAVALLRSLDRVGGWDALRLQGLTEADAAAWETAAVETGYAAVETERRFANLVLDIAAARAAPEAKTTRKERSLMRSGTVTYQAARVPELRAALAAFRTGERSSWKLAGGELISASPEILRFYDGLAAAAERGAGPELAVRLLRRDDVVVAGLITASESGTEVALKIFYDAAAAKHSPGTFLLRRMCEEAADDAAIGFVDFFSTSPAYTRLTNTVHPCRDLTIWHRSVRAGLLRGARLALRTARRLRET
jgi:CelD/BcsL family acetyltransferase involved in cellulose biosynthesis